MIIGTAKFQQIREAIEQNGGYCPCKIAKNKDTKCMCKEFREQIKQGIEGTCGCGAYAVVKEPKDKIIEELQAQIEQMKCCANCKHEYYSFGDEMCDSKVCVNYSDWQLKPRAQK